MEELTLGIYYMSDIKDEIANSPIIEAIDHIRETYQDPSPEVLLADLKFATKLVLKLKQDLEGTHPSIINLIKVLL